MCKLLLKLPGSARYRWSRNVLTLCRRPKREPDLTDFIHFSNNETLIVSDPIFSKKVVEQYIDKRLNSRRTKVSSFVTKYEGKGRVEKKKKRNQLIASIVVKIIY